MPEDLPSVNKPERLVITEDSLGGAESAAPAPALVPPPSAVPAPGALPRGGAGSAASGSQGLPAVKTPAVPGATSFCHACGRPIDPRAVMCPACGVPQQAAATTVATVATLTLKQKSSGMAILLSLFLPGAGQWYMGRVGRGFAFFGAYVVSWILVLAIIGFFLLPIVFVWAAIDANKLANRHNADLLTETTGIVPGSVV